MNLTLRTYPLEHGVTGRAIFCKHQGPGIEPCHRYALYRKQVDFIHESVKDGNGHHCRTLATIGMNPSAAAADQDDLTVRMWWNMAKRAGYCKLVALNAYAYRATDPAELMHPQDGADIVGAKTDARILSEVIWADMVLATWGAIPLARDQELRKVLRYVRGKVFCLGLTSTGQPRHPRGVARDTEWKPLPFPDEPEA